MKYTNQKGVIFIPIIILISLVLMGAIVIYTKSRLKKLSQDNFSSSLSKNSKFDLSDLMMASTLTPTPSPKTTTKPKFSPIAKPKTPTPSSQPTFAPTGNPTPTPTPYWSREAPVLSVTGPFTIGESGPCFNLESQHPYNYSQSAEYKFDESESSYRFTTLNAWGDIHKGTVCWVKDPSKTGKQYVFKGKSYTDSTPERIYSAEISLPYIHP